MKLSLTTIVLSFLAAVAASLAWFCAVTANTGEGHVLRACLLDSSGILFAALAGLMLGTQHKENLPLASAVVGWLAIAPFTPVAFSLANPVPPHGPDHFGVQIPLLLLFCIAGVSCTLLGARIRRRRSVGRS